MNIISLNESVLAVYVRSEEWKPGLNFISQDEHFIQVGLWQYEPGKKLGPHKHRPNQRIVQHTQELIFVKKGRVKVSVYAENNELINQIELCSGDLIILLSGGHGYEILEPDTQVLEVKNGPYTGLADRETFNE